MSISKTVEIMRKLVSVYDDIEEKKNRALAKKEKLVYFMKGGNNMKFGTIIGIVVGAIALIAAGAAAMYYFLEGGFPKCKCLCKKDEDDLYDDFPEEQIITDSDEVTE